MTPFSTAERKVLGVAAPTQVQTPLNWPYLPPPNPYNIQARLTGFVNQIYVQAASTRDVAAVAAAAAPVVSMLRRDPSVIAFSVVIAQAAGARYSCCCTALSARGEP